DSEEFKILMEIGDEIENQLVNEYNNGDTNERARMTGRLFGQVVLLIFSTKGIAEAEAVALESIEECLLSEDAETVFEKVHEVIRNGDMLHIKMEATSGEAAVEFDVSVDKLEADLESNLENEGLT
ncbi:MAG: hypothetical protein Q8936_22330, partial [Bacillota bacterium]|nr:hypothetical protein [Bacillota bacterium]